MKCAYQKKEEEQEEDIYTSLQQLFAGKWSAEDDLLMWPQDRESSFSLFTSVIFYHVVYFWYYKYIYPHFILAGIGL